MQMAGNLARLRLGRRFVAKNEAADGDLPRHHAAEPGRRMRIVIALDPDPFAAADEGSERGAFLYVEPLGGVAVVEGIAQRDHPCRAIARDQRRHALEGRACVIGRQERAKARQRRALLEMDVGEDERALCRPPRRAGAVEQQALAVHFNRTIVRHLLQH